MLGHTVPPLWLFFAMALTGSVVVMVVCRLLAVVERGALTHLGRNSLILVCVHEPIKRVVVQLMAMVTGQTTDILRHDILLSVVCVALVVAVCLPIIYLVNRYVPAVVGGRKG